LLTSWSAKKKIDSFHVNAWETKHGKEGRSALSCVDKIGYVRLKVLLFYLYARNE
jgi:hypothetical protein